MAFNFGSRLTPPPKYCMLLDPGAYQIVDEPPKKRNIAPFLARTPRITALIEPLWTHSIYDVSKPPKIQNCTSMQSKCPRFPYKTFSEKDLEILLCCCGLENECVCPTQEKIHEKLCQGKVRKKIFIGLNPKSIMGEGLSAPSKNDLGFEILTDGKKKRLLKTVIDKSPPLYDASVYESASFYHGCKWSKWSSKRSKHYNMLESRPGPADNFFIKIPADYEICLDKLRAYRRQTSKQLRFIEMLQQRDILEGRPGPATYNPKFPKGYEIQHLGAKAERFNKSAIEQRPGPADHNIKRTFDLAAPPDKLCHAKLPAPSFFGVKDVRFKLKKEEGPSPATYSPLFKKCNLVHCSTTPFSSSSKRFQEHQNEKHYDDLIVEENELQNMHIKENTAKEACHSRTWQFKSKTIRMMPLLKKLNSPSPADLPQTKTNIYRSRHLQFTAPFLASGGRFEPWNDWMPVQGNLKTPGPCIYALEKPNSTSAVTRGPLCRSARFYKNQNYNPSPNKYNVGGGIETVLETHNQKLKNNIKIKSKFIWTPLLKPKRLSYEEQDILLLNKSIALLDTNIIVDKNSDKSLSNKSNPRLDETKKPKLL